jgi:hypothetical protein
MHIKGPHQKGFAKIASAREEFEPRFYPKRTVVHETPM